MPKDKISDSDIWSVAYEIYCAGGYMDDGNEPNPPTDGIRKLLERQAEITKRETLHDNPTHIVNQPTSVTIVGLFYECPKCGERIFLPNPDPFEMLSLHQSCMHWTCAKCGKSIELTSADILETIYGSSVTYTGETAVRHPIVSENRGGIWRDVRGIANAVRDAVRKAIRRSDND